MKGIPLFLLFLTVFWLGGCSPEPERSVDQKEEAIDASGNSVRQEKAEVILTDLDVPWTIQKTGEEFYISERTGSIVHWKNGEMKRQNVELGKRLSQNPEAGLLGFVLAPNFETSHLAFVYYTYEQNGNPKNRVVSLLFENDRWQEKRVLLDGIPSGTYHHGGRMKIGPDGKLFVITGDAHQDEIAQEMQSLGGKILRMNLDGSIPSDNPFPNSYVYSLGHRNPQGLAWDEDGQLYSSEHGPSAHDEINAIKPGKNYGWPLITGDETKPGLESPLFQSGDDTWAPSGIDYHEDTIYAAALRGQAVKAFHLKTKKINNVVEGLGRIRDVLIDGNYLYFISNNTDGRGTPREGDDKLYRMDLLSK
ncbi:quinoprotein glucose dehydrogenase [Peribacillus saganii]|uniref:Quinoprotein glucose dehydrogenase n=1 Tax=Peribacillus saganii TaxID=2303992 RepID=A0A372LNI7_9BACI|nr:PQQ-dependent sugar dehydrogenase [Peribacillus saganii]RFU69157.1 quinoprotein glucose dehydrogenase [Peribacillus saganii]